MEDGTTETTETTVKPEVLVGDKKTRAAKDSGININITTPASAPAPVAAPTQETKMSAGFSEEQLLAKLQKEMEAKYAAQAQEQADKIEQARKEAAEEIARLREETRLEKLRAFKEVACVKAGVHFSEVVTGNSEEEIAQAVSAQVEKEKAFAEKLLDGKRKESLNSQTPLETSKSSAQPVSIKSRAEVLRMSPSDLKAYEASVLAQFAQHSG